MDTVHTFPEERKKLEKINYCKGRLLYLTSLQNVSLCLLGHVNFFFFFFFGILYTYIHTSLALE